jgi:hypothetical protein
MYSRVVDRGDLRKDEDWAGNNVAFTCPRKDCGRVFLVSGMPSIHGGTRLCPGCQKSTGYVTGGKESGGTARIEWSD